jgi:subtilisin family serine protease
VAGDHQAAFTNAALPTLLTVRASDDQDAPVSGVRVSFAVTSGGGSVSPVEVRTDAQGLARSQWTLGPTAGAQTATAGAPGLTPITFSAVALVPPPASTILGSVTVGSGFLAPPAAIARLPTSSRLPAGDAGVRVGFPPGGRAAVANELVVHYRAAGFASLLQGLGAPASRSQALAVQQAIRTRLQAELATGRVALAGVSPFVFAARLRVQDPALLDAVAARIGRDPAVLAVTRARWLRPHGRPGLVPNDPNYPNQSWHYTMVDLPRAWALTTGSPGVVVAVVDQGIRFDHPAIGKAGGTYLDPGGNLLGDGYDFVSTGQIPICGSPTDSVDNASDGDGYDPDPTTPDDRDVGFNCVASTSSPVGGHGLHVAGTIGAVGNDGLGVVGVNWTVRIRPVRVLGLAGGTDYDVAQGILYAAGLPADDGAGGVVQLPPAALPTRIINLSLGGDCPAPGAPDVLHDAVLAASGAGVLLVASAGNAASAQPSCPAAYPEVLSVGAVGPSGNRAGYSNFGPTVDLAAPGGDFAEGNFQDGTFGVFSTTCDFTTVPCTPNQARYAGTSMAAPHVSGVAALILAREPGLTAAELRNRLVTYATPISPTFGIGAGIVNARNSLTRTPGPATQLYARLVDPATGSVVATQLTSGGQFAFTGLADGAYLVYAGEDEDGDGLLGVADRRFGALGGAASPTAVPVSGSAGARADFTIGFPGEREPNNTAGSANPLPVPGALAGNLAPGDADVVRVRIPSAGTYTFETAGFSGAFCGFGPNVNTAIAVLDAGGATLASSDDQAGNDFCGRLTLPLQAGPYFVVVTVGQTPSQILPDPIGDQGHYYLEVRPGP